MKLLGWIILAALVLLAFFTIANWSLFTAVATLDFLAFTVEGPLGLVLLGVTLALVSIFAIYALSLRTSALMDAKRHMKELETQRELADKAEASRFTALGAQLEQEFARLRASIEESRTQALQRADAADQFHAASLNETANAIFANIGQVDDKLNRLTPPAAGAVKPS